MDQPLNTRTQKFTLLSSLYLAQGLPYGFFTLALPVLLRDAGFSLKVISITSLLYLPWATKFLWAAFLDHRGTRRQWLLALQISSVLGALLLTQLDLDRSSLVVLFVAAFAFNVIAASQDIVTDGLAVRMLETRERGVGNGIQVGAYRLGMICGGGALLWVFAKSGWDTMFLCMAVLLVFTILPVLTFVEPARAPVEKSLAMGQLALGWARRLLMPGMLGFAGLIFCFRFGDAMISTLLGPFLSDQGLSKESIALMKGTVGSATSLVGALIGGWFVFAVQRRTAMLVTGLAQALSFIPYCVAALGIGGVELLWTATVIEGLLGTTATVALFALMMDASDPDNAGTDYTLFASVVVLVNGVGSFSGAVIGDALGFAPMFAIATVFCVAGSLLLVWMLDRQALPARVAERWRGYAAG